MPLEPWFRWGAALWRPTVCGTPIVQAIPLEVVYRMIATNVLQVEPQRERYSLLLPRLTLTTTVAELVELVVDDLIKTLPAGAWMGTPDSCRQGAIHRVHGLIAFLNRGKVYA